MANDVTRIITPIQNQLLAEIDDYRFNRRVPSRAEAIRRLIAIGLKAERAVRNDGSELTS